MATGIQFFVIVKRFNGKNFFVRHDQMPGLSSKRKIMVLKVEKAEVRMAKNEATIF
jgi:hypothetical protein